MTTNTREELLMRFLELLTEGQLKLINQGHHDKSYNLQTVAKILFTDYVKIEERNNLICYFLVFFGLMIPCILIYLGTR